MENNIEISSPNPIAQHSQPLPTKIKQIIQSHYSSLSKKEVNEKVRTQVIPILIMLFFDNQNTNQQNIMHVLNSIKVGVDTATYVDVGADGSLGSFKNILMENCNVGNLGIGKERQRVSGCKEDWDKQGMYISRFGGSRNRKLSSSHTDSSLNKQNQQRIRTFLQKNKQLSAQCLIQKTISVFKLCRGVEKAQVLRQHMHELFNIYKRGKKYRIKQLRWLSQFVERQRILMAIRMFYKNMNKQNNLQPIQQQCTEIQQGKINAHKHKLRKIVINRFICVLQAKMYTTFREFMHKLCCITSKDRKDRIHKWMTKFVRAFVYSTPANLQTSLWRLINFGNKQDQNILQNQHQDKKQKQQLRLCQQEVLPDTKQGQNKVDQGGQGELMNNKKQKTNVQSSCQQERSFSMIRCESKQLNRTQSNNLSENIFQKHIGDDGALHPAGFQVASLSNCLSLPCIEDEVKTNEQKEQTRQNVQVEEHQQFIGEIVRDEVEEIIGNYIEKAKVQ